VISRALTRFAAIRLEWQPHTENPLERKLRPADI